MFVRSYISELQFNPLTEESRILHFMYVSNGSDLILPENFFREAGLPLLSISAFY